MQRFSGQRICGGSAGGTAVYADGYQGNRDQSAPLTDRMLTRTPERELRRFLRARDGAASALRSMAAQAGEELGGEGAAVFQARVLIAEDPLLVNGVESRILEDHLIAETAVREAVDAQAAKFLLLPDAYMRGRAEDIRSVGRLLLEKLQGQPSGAAPGKREKNDSREQEEGRGHEGGRQDGGHGDGMEKIILLADELTPELLLRRDLHRIAGIAAVRGSADGHGAILVRSLGIPCLIGCADIREDWAGHRLFLDGDREELCLDPPALPDRAGGRDRKSGLNGADGGDSKAGVNGAGDAVKDISSFSAFPTLMANISFPEEAARAKALGAAGVGLYRSEYLFLGRDGWPGEEEQRLAYERAARAIAPAPVIIRTMDLGADKLPSYMKGEGKRGNAGDCRGIRFALRHREQFAVQLRALLRAAVSGNVRVMLPMVTAAAEVQAVKCLLRGCAEELRREGRAFGNPPLGVMIETPAAVLCAEKLSEEAAFFSVGTNDLGQYTFGSGRESGFSSPASETPELAEAAKERRDILLQEIRMAAEAAHRSGIPVGICGELAGDVTLLPVWRELKIDSISLGMGMLPAFLPHLP